MTNTHSAGADKEPLPSGVSVFRLCPYIELGEDLAVPESSFVPSSDDREDTQKLNRISVWAEWLTTEEQASEIRKKPKSHFVFFRLDVDEVNQLVPVPQTTPPWNPLSVTWQPRMDPVYKIQDTSPGAEGHAGIHDLCIKNVPNKKAAQLSLRGQLARLANADLNRRGVLAQVGS